MQAGFLVECVRQHDIVLLLAVAVCRRNVHAGIARAPAPDAVSETNLTGSLVQAVNVFSAVLFMRVAGTFPAFPPTATLRTETGSTLSRDFTTGRQANAGFRTRLALSGEQITTGGVSFRSVRRLPAFEVMTLLGIANRGHDRAIAPAPSTARVYGGIVHTPDFGSSAVATTPNCRHRLTLWL